MEMPGPWMASRAIVVHCAGGHLGEDERIHAGHRAANRIAGDLDRFRAGDFEEDAAVAALSGAVEGAAAQRDARGVPDPEQRSRVAVGGLEGGAGFAVEDDVPALDDQGAGEQMRSPPPRESDRRRSGQTEGRLTRRLRQRLHPSRTEGVR